jgi:pantoate--beta-alanine ligase
VKIARTEKEVKELVLGFKNANLKIGCVPTMGALHHGHNSLVNKALMDNDVVFVSIFVNPTQFNNKQDLNKYPRTLERDIEMLKSISRHSIIVYAADAKDIYPNGLRAISFDFDGLEKVMEGKYRPGHFDGVGTVVKRLFEIITPDKAYFGEKDFQQLQIIKKLVDKYGLAVDIVGCPIYREESGLAMSSRNERLKGDYNLAAPFIYKTLLTAKSKFGTESALKVAEWVERQFANHELLKLEYFTIADETSLKPIKRKQKNKKYRAFIAVYADDIRLIDNVALN